ncbi:hypothetical protein BJF78_11465 [Pseudonocardia sp. CNS-139]|nr:hypothetical protein BJF78_11465 [Pseudonocardia sp. CNS-139]
MAGRHQCDNAALAVTAAEAFLGTPLRAGGVTAALEPLQVPGRAEIVGRAPLVLVDGAHNAAGAAALRRTVDELGAAANRKVLVCGVLAGRVVAEFLTYLGVGGYDLVVATEPGSPRALPADTVAATARWLGTPSITVSDPAAALARAVDAAGPDGTVVGTGSLHLVGALRRAAGGTRAVGLP